MYQPNEVSNLGFGHSQKSNIGAAAVAAEENRISIMERGDERSSSSEEEPFDKAATTEDNVSKQEESKQVASSQKSVKEPWELLNSEMAASGFSTDQQMKNLREIGEL